MRTTIGVTAALLIALTGCSSDANSENKINGMDRNKAAVECQKFLASTSPGMKLSDFPTVGASGLRKVNVDGAEHWQVNGDVDGREYTCRVTPSDADNAEVEGAFSM